MASTRQINIPGDRWTEVTGFANYLAVQTKEQEQLLIHVGEEEPDAANMAGLLIAYGRPGVPTSFAAGGLPQGVRVFIRPKGSANADPVIVVY